MIRLSSDASELIIRNVLTFIQTGEGDCRQLAAAATANDKAISSYMRINKLDDAPKEQIRIRFEDA